MIAPRQYRFASRVQWERGIVERFDVSDDGLNPIPRVGLHAVHEIAGSFDEVAVDAYGTVRVRGRDATLRRREVEGRLSTPLEVDDTLARTPRWMTDRHGLWAFDPNASIVRRDDAETLQHEWTVEVPPGRTLVDIASDGREGAWALLRDASGAAWLLHIDCDGRTRNTLKVQCTVGAALALGSVLRGRRLAILSDEGRRLTYLDVPGGDVARIVDVRDLVACGRARRMSSDAGHRIALWCAPADPKSPWALVILDGSGERLEGPWSDSNWTAPIPAGLAAPPDPVTLGIAVYRDTVWFAGTTGLWRLDGGKASIARESESTFMTPALESPESDAGRGWMRAEIDIDLPEGAVLEAQYRSTGKPKIADQVREISVDPTTPSARKLEAMWAALEAPLDDMELERQRGRRRFTITGPQSGRTPIAIPLFDTADRWLWLRIDLHTPPGTPPAPIRELRVLYPDSGLMQYLPAIYRGTRGDPTGLVRTLVGLLETTTQSLDDRIGSIGAQMDPGEATPEWFDFLGAWLDLPWNDALPDMAKRALLRNAADLIAWRGTRRGLELLLRCVLGTDARVRVTDVTVRHALARVSGDRCEGTTLPALLAGASSRAPVLGEKSVLGRACLGQDCDPVAGIAPTVRIQIDAGESTRRAMGSAVERVVSQYVPAGVRIAVQWRRGAWSGRDEAIQVLDARGSARLGQDSEIGRTLVRGHHAPWMDDWGMEIGFELP